MDKFLVKFVVILYLAAQDGTPIYNEEGERTVMYQDTMEVEYQDLHEAFDQTVNSPIGEVFIIEIKTEK